MLPGRSLVCPLAGHRYAPWQVTGVPSKAPTYHWYAPQKVTGMPPDRKKGNNKTLTVDVM